ncbi:MAG: YdeI/OmpD-associated family protein [Parvibaculaceae bacterium]
MGANPKIDALLKKPEWQKERKALRTILLECGLTEDVKWGKLCYMYEGSNIVLICGLKESCALNFLKGALLKDTKKLLVAPGENSQSARWMKFTGVDEIGKKTMVLRSYIREAIKAEKAGLKVDFKAKKDLALADELQNALAKYPALKKAFTALTPGRQKAYNLFFSAAKQTQTRASRIEKSTPDILAGKGLNDR